MKHNHSNPAKFQWKPLIERWVRTIVRVGKGSSSANLLRGLGGYNTGHSNGRSTKTPDMKRFGIPLPHPRTIQRKRSGYSTENGTY